MEKVILVDIEKCTGCGRCTLVCSGLKEGVFAPSKSRIHLVNFAREGLSVPNVCFHCEEPACAEACPVEAISRNGTGAVVVDRDACTGCGVCVEACPYGMIWLDDEGLACKCDLCRGDPECVKVCQPGAIAFAVPEGNSLEERIFQMSKKSGRDDPRERRLEIAEIFRERYR
ncbi:MAG: 4Fe-4S dicluster domain-containing protein [Deltaproteobacteria bacterium]|nr:4Fe-4S dicluster domain-containing protein [Deltaproteobacteria bacterium]MBW2121103.1 4Fe-4S dicluster domain-containing protein [Deltaproteobacteria bacterium]